MNRDSSNRLKRGFATRTIHTGHNPADYLGALTPPVFVTSTYAFETAEAGEQFFGSNGKGACTGGHAIPRKPLLRNASPVWRTPRRHLPPRPAWLRSVRPYEPCCRQETRSLSAIPFVATVLPCLSGTNSLRSEGPGCGLHGSECRSGAIAKGAPKVIFFETPANPNLRIIDIPAIGRMAHESGALLIVDNTFATPALQQLIPFGADLVIHSATKFIDGHGDLIAGVVPGPKESSSTSGVMSCVTSLVPPSSR
jgi:methionine-gamma-lyase